MGKGAPEAGMEALRVQGSRVGAAPGRVGSPGSGREAEMPAGPNCDGGPSGPSDCLVFPESSCSKAAFLVYLSCISMYA